MSILAIIINHSFKNSCTGFWSEILNNKVVNKYISIDKKIGVKKI